VKVRIQDLPFRTLKVLLSHPHQVVTREQFRQAFWPEHVFVDFDLGIRSAIERLRDALGDSAENPIFVVTVDRRGYRWIAPAHLQEAASAAGAATPEREADADLVSDPEAISIETRSPGPGGRKRRTGWTLGVVAGLAIAMVLVLLQAVSSTRRLFGNPDTSAVHLVAVLPFQNAGSDKDAEFLRLALPDEVANVLSYVPSLSIRPLATTSRYSGPNLDLQKAGREMGVTSIVTGHYLTEGDQLEITAGSGRCCQ
jgi:DNA-binding winged helix-turn-helix (wHTH) protein